MPAVSGSPTQIKTSVVTAADLSGTPDDQFEAGDLAYVSALYPNAQFILRRVALSPTPDNVTVIATKSGNGYWELSQSAYVSGGSSGLYNPPLASLVTTDAAMHVLANVIPAFVLALSAAKKLIVDVTTTVEGINNSVPAFNAYRIDLNASFTLDAGVATQLGTTATANERVVVAGPPPVATIGATGDIEVTGALAAPTEEWYWSATTSVFYKIASA